MKRSILTITKDNLILEVIDSKNILAWKSGGLEAALKKLLNSRDDVDHDNIRILLAEDFYYLVGFEVNTPKGTSKKLENDRNKIKDLAEELIPENLDEVKWDYSVINRDQDKFFIQCFALTKDFSDELSIVISELNLKVDVIEPYALALASSFKPSKHSFLLLHKDESVSMGVVIKNNLITFSKNLDMANINDIDEVIAFSKKFGGIEISKVLLSGVDGGLVEDLGESLKTSKVDISASSNLVEKKLIKGKDSKVLNLDEKSGPEIMAEVDQEDSVDNKNSFNLFLILWVIAILGVTLGFFVSRFFI